jgi:ribosomal protein S18 acetylase RimI-like enzyme
MITFRQMTDSEFQSYLESAIIGYAAEKVQAGNWDESNALQRSRDAHQEYLPQGAKTPNNFLNILANEEGQAVGYIWYSILENVKSTLFLYDFEVYENFRRKGYALQSLNVLEGKARELRCEHIELHVFGFNTGAQALYEKAGYFVTNINMKKTIK